MHDLSLELQTKILGLKIWIRHKLPAPGNIGIGDREASRGKAKQEVVWFMVKNKWQELSPELWAWRPQYTLYRRCQSCNFDQNCKHGGKSYGYTLWIPMVRLLFEISESGYRTHIIS